MHVLSARGAGQPVCLHHHTYGYIIERSLLMRLICAAAGPRLTHVFLSTTMRDDFAEQYTLKTTSAVIPNAMFVPEQDHKPRSFTGAWEDRRLQVGLISNLDAAKGLHDFIETARHAKRANLAVDMILAGPIKNSDDKALVAQAQQEGSVRWLGPLYGEDKLHFYAGLDLFLFPTRYRYEAQPTVIYEAFAHGVPVVAFERGCIRAQVGDCLRVIKAAQDFPKAATQIISELIALPDEDWSTLRQQTRVRLRSHTEAGERTLIELFGCPSTDKLN